jgi:hypothetical protein
LGVATLICSVSSIARSTAPVLLDPNPWVEKAATVASQAIAGSQYQRELCCFFAALIDLFN